MTSALNYLPEKINPNFYINNQDAYLDELNDYYTRSKFNDSMIYLFLIIFFFRRYKKLKMSDYELFLAFERNEYINSQDLPILENFICGHLIHAIHLIELTTINNLIMLLNFLLFAIGNKSVVCLFVLGEEKQYVKVGFLIFLRMKSTKILFVQ